MEYVGIKWENQPTSYRESILAQTAALTTDICINRLSKDLIDTFYCMGQVDRYEFISNIAKDFESQYCGTYEYENEFSTFAEKIIKEMLIKELSPSEDNECIYNQIESLVLAKAKEITDIKNQITEREKRHDEIYTQKYDSLANYLKKMCKILDPLKAECELEINTGITYKNDLIYFVYDYGKAPSFLIRWHMNLLGYFKINFGEHSMLNSENCYRLAKRKHGDYVIQNYKHHYDIDYILDNFNTKVFEESLYKALVDYTAQKISLEKKKLDKIS